MRLPCRHIFAVRDEAGINLFEATLCDERWTTKYYKESQRIFCSDVCDDNPSVEILQLSPHKRISLFQVPNKDLISVASTLASFFIWTMQSEKFHQASKISMKLASLASEASGSSFDIRCELLTQFILAWEKDVPIHLVKGIGNIDTSEENSI